MPRTVTVEQLQAWYACPDQVQLFFETFGDAAVVSPETLDMAETAGLDLWWLAERVLSPPVLASLTRTTDAAWAEYIRVTNAALAEYIRVKNAARADYNWVRDAAWADCDRVRADALIALLLDDANWQEGAA